MLDTSLKFQELENSQSTRQTTRVIHYGCESWYSVKDRPVIISCIAIVDLATKEEIAFSLTDYDCSEETEREKLLLESYYKYLKETPDALYVHWNMNTSEYGFVAIDKRYKFDPPYFIPKEKRYDLDDLIAQRYGKEYVEHPKLPTLISLNKLQKRFYLSGKDESDKFEAKEFGDIKRSILEKSHLLASLTKKLLKGTIETRSSGPRIVFASEKIDAVETVLEIGKKFKQVSRQIKTRYANRTTLEITDEYDAQDLFHSLMRLFFDDIRTEEWIPSYAGGNKRTDFLLPDYSISVELKHSRQKMTAKDLGDQLIVDIANYEKHPNIRIIVNLVFDYEGYIKNPKGIEKDLSYTKNRFTVITKIFS